MTENLMTMGKNELNQLLSNIKVSYKNKIYQMDNNSMGNMKDSLQFLEGIMDIEMPIPTEDNPNPKNPLEDLTEMEIGLILGVKGAEFITYRDIGGHESQLTISDMRKILAKASISKWLIYQKYYQSNQ